MTSIRPGDLVVVVRWPCCHTETGKVFTVGEINGEGVTCSMCGASYPGVPTAVSAAPPRTGELRRVPVSWLKRIPPLEELEGQRDQVPEAV